jgi:hypothetical protein
MVAGNNTNDYYGLVNPASESDNGDLVTTVIGGLNTESNPMGMPTGDSPDMLNIQISPAGTLTKRPGTIIRDESLYSNTAAAPKGNGLVSLNIANGHTIIVGKVGRDLLCELVCFHEKMGRSNLTYPRLVFEDIWTADATLKPSFTVVPSAIPRVLIATGNNTVVECVVYTKTITVSSPTSSVAIEDKPFAEIPTFLLLDAGRSNTVDVETILFIPNYVTDEENWVVYRANTKSTTTNTVTFSSGFRSVMSTGAYGNLPAGSYTVLRFGWVMWTESIMIDASQATQPLLLSPDSYAILVPEEQGRNAAEDRRLNAGVSGAFRYSPFSLSRTNDTEATQQWFAPFSQFPDTGVGATECIFAVSETQVYTETITDPIEEKWFPVGDTYVIPRDLSSLSSNTFYLHRHYRNWLHNNAGLMDSRDVRCTFNPYTSEEVNLALLTSYTDGYTFPQTPDRPNPTSWLTGTKSYAASVDALWFTPAKANTTDYNYWAFTGSYPLGLPSGYGSLSNYISFVSHSYIGDENTVDDAGTGGTGYTDHGKVRFRNKSKVPVGGLYEFSTFSDDTSTRDFGRLVSYFQNRIVLSGFSKYPNLLAFSNSSYEYEWDVGGNLLASNRNFQTWYSDPNLAFNPLQVQISTDSGEYITALLPAENTLLVFTNRSVHIVTSTENSGYVTPTSYVTSKLLDIGSFNQNTVATTEAGIVFLSKSGLYLLVPSTDTTGRYTPIPLSSKVKRIFNDMSLEATSNHWITVDKDQVLYVGICTQGSNVATRLLTFDMRLRAWSEYATSNGFWFSTMGLCLPSGRVFVDFITSTNLLLGTAGSTHLLVEFSKYAKLDFVVSKTGATSYSSISPIPSFVAALPYNASQQFYNYDLRTVNSTNVLRTIDIYDVVDSVSTLNGGTQEARPIDPRTSLYPVYANVDNVWVDWNSGISGINAASKVLLGSGFPVWVRSAVITRAYMSGVRQDNHSKRYSHCILHFRNPDNSQFIHSDLNTAASQAASTIVDKYKTTYDANLSLIFDGSHATTQYLVYDNTTNVDTYGSLTLPKIRRDTTSRIVLPFLGVNHSAQICVFSYGYHEFELIGYQLISRRVGSKHRSWQDLY